MAQWLRCCVTNRKVAGSIPDCVIGIFHWHNPSDRTMVLGSTQPKWESGEFPGDKCGRCVRLTTLQPPCAVVMESGNLNFLETSGPLQACNGTDLPLPTELSLWTKTDGRTRKSAFSSRSVRTCCLQSAVTLDYFSIIRNTDRIFVPILQRLIHLKAIIKSAFTLSINH